MTRFLRFLFVGAVLCNSGVATALPVGFTGRYRILQSRALALTFTHDFAIQDGSLISLAALNTARPWCRSDQPTFADLEGDIAVTFSPAPGGSETATLRTIPSTSSRAATTFTCVSRDGFTGALDLTIALGRIVEFHR